jgi:hypothetical protein
VFWEVDEEEGADDAQSSSDEEEENEQREQVQMDEDEDEAPVSETLDQPEPQHAKQQGKSLKLGAKLGAQAGKNELVCKVGVVGWDVRLQNPSLTSCSKHVCTG